MKAIWKANRVDFRPSNVDPNNLGASHWQNAETETTVFWIVAFLVATGDTWRSFPRSELNAWAFEHGHRPAGIHFNKLSVYDDNDSRSEYADLITEPLGDNDIRMVPTTRFLSR